MEDLEIVKRVYTHESIFDRINDDGITDPEKVDFSQALSNTNVFFLIAEDEHCDIVGVFLFHPWNTVCYEMHSAVLPEYRGEGSIEAARMAGMWMFGNTMCQKIVTQIAVTNYAARTLARVGGMVKIGNNDRSFLKNGKLIDQHIYGICKEDV